MLFFFLMGIKETKLSVPILCVSCCSVHSFDCWWILVHSYWILSLEASISSHRRTINMNHSWGDADVQPFAKYRCWMNLVWWAQNSHCWTIMIYIYNNSNNNSNNNNNNGIDIYFFWLIALVGQNLPHTQPVSPKLGQIGAASGWMVCVKSSIFEAENHKVHLYVIYTHNAHIIHT